MIENVLAKDINGLEPRLTRQGYKREGFGRAAQRVLSRLIFNPSHRSIFSAKKLGQPRSDLPAQ